MFASFPRYSQVRVRFPIPEVFHSELEKARWHWESCAVNIVCERYANLYTYNYTYIYILYIIMSHDIHIYSLYIHTLYITYRWISRNFHCQIGFRVKFGQCLTLKRYRAPVLDYNNHSKNERIHNPKYSICLYLCKIWVYIYILICMVCICIYVYI